MSPSNSTYQALPRGASASLQSLLATRFGAAALKLASVRPARSLLAGNHKTRARGRGMDFEEVRHYQAGDDVRAIDWRVTARTEIPHTKVYREERERPVLFLCDMRPGMGFGSVNCFKSVMAAHLAAHLAWATLEGGDKIGALVLEAAAEHDIRPKRSKSAVLELIAQLVRSTEQLLQPPVADETRGFADYLKQLRRIAAPGTKLYLISDFNDFDAEAERELSLLARHASLNLMHIFDPLEARLVANGPLTLSNGRDQLRINAGQAQFQIAYADAFSANLAKLTHTANRLGAPLVSISTAEDLPQLLHRLYGRRG